MTAKKVYVVNVRVNFDMFVVAASEDEARIVAKEHAGDELENWRLRLGEPHECDPNTHGSQDSIPWGESDDEENPDKTVAEYMAGVLESRRAAEEAARIEANQLKLPLGGGAE